MWKRNGYFGILLLASWLVMTFVHESGHVLCGWASGGTLQQAELAPWQMPYSHFDPDPMPLVTVWGGPILGVLIPLLLAGLIRRHWMWFIAYFCLLANGSYLAIAWYTGERHLDTAKLLEHGAQPVLIAAYCLVTIAVGYVGFRRQCMYVLASEAPSHTKS